MTESVAIVVVTYNRAEMLRTLLAGLAELKPAPDAVLVVDNASSDDTAEVLHDFDTRLRATQSPMALQIIASPENLGGAGGFHLGVAAAYEQGFDRIWLMDDDVLPAPDCLAVLLAQNEACVMSVRDEPDGRLAEYAATRFDLRNPLVIRPKRASVVSTYPTRDAMPPKVELQNVAFEGFMVKREVVGRFGLPDPSFFIFYDDVDFALRARRAGYRLWAVRDAVMHRQLAFSQQHDLAGWKGYFMYRNLFAVHFRYGQNALVRAKPWVITAAVVLLSLGTRRWGVVRNITRALRDARGMRALPTASVD